MKETRHLDKYDCEAEREGKCLRVRESRRVRISKQFNHKDKEIRQLFGR